MAGSLTLSTLSDGTNSTNATDVVRGSARAWVNFNGVSGASIRASYNISSVTRNGTGDYTVNFTTAMPDTNYSIQSMAGRFGTGGERVAVNYIHDYTTSSIRVYNNNSSGTWFDQPSMFVAVFR